MVLLISKEMKEGFVKFDQGFSWVQHALLRTDDTSDTILDSINGEFDPDIQTYYQQCFQHSFDEEAAELSLFVEEYLGEAIRHTPPSETASSLSMLVKGLDLMIEGLKEITIQCKEDAEAKLQLAQFKNSNGYHPFKGRDPVQFRRPLGHFRRTLIAALKKEMGSKRYHFYLRHEEI